ncbi:MAG TPA: ATP-binding protein [Solirubrobacteraceae bacterium]|nr:ATP-binding protein [Solirubrobacteraceae bacterium]
MPAGTSTSERVIQLPATAAAAGIARRELAATPGLGGEIGYKVLLLASELIAVFVADLEPRPDRVLCLSVTVAPERVRIEVGGGDAPEVSPDALLHSHETPSLGGMGLQIVERMADSWGQGSGNREIWFELTR